KPDHLGDVVLSAPAIAALRRRFPNMILLCHPSTAGLAQELFPGLALWPVLFPHLDRSCTSETDDLAIDPRVLKGLVDLLVCLRWDGEMERLARASQVEYRTAGPVPMEIHVAREQENVVAPLAGDYDILSS